MVLDEFTYLLSYGMLDVEPLLAFLANRPDGMHVVITGRGAPQALLDAADLVTEMRVVKHPYESGIKAQKGVEF
jgi:cob(I)alamin adenosyltransferase